MSLRSPNLLTENQFAAFKTLAHVMDTGGQTPEQTAVNAHAVGLPWRHICTLTGLDADTVHAVLLKARAVTS